VTHNLVIRSVSKGLTIIFGTCIFMVNLNMHICKSKRLASRGFTIMFLYDSHMQRKREIHIKLYPKLWIYNAKGIHQLKIHKVSIQFSDEHVHCNRTLTSQLHDGCFKNGFATSYWSLINRLKMWVA
jgi:hypothetical protein